MSPMNRRTGVELQGDWEMFLVQVIHVRTAGSEQSCYDVTMLLVIITTVYIKNNENNELTQGGTLMSSAGYAVSSLPWILSRNA
jgi:hypothetical protein